MEPIDPKEERRLHLRLGVLKHATILAGAQNAEITCSVRNQHKHGAELRVAPDASVPDRFLLHVPVDGVTYQTVVRWRKNDRLGVQFFGVTR
ncbi:PilZ domain-containing protein [Mesorhizobium sp. AR10]|uniref:PilZ domain-containing protein n=1 Tax=Mesorhizobium sp. AR10 TaxID=2865839 RepID=UPI002160F4F3|nr:PilZ domain-containing protein [Mesorhizobium sp. AR10]UVK36533.1 PilZ domain-containing protein [Mesorhizobium sp. AR10]